MKRTYSQIDMDERRKIARWRTAGISVDVIAEKLHRHRSTIFVSCAATPSRIARCRTSTVTTV